MPIVKKEKTQKTSTQVAAQKEAVRKELKEKKATPSTASKVAALKEEGTVSEKKTAAKSKKETVKLPTRTSALSKDQVSDLLAFVTHKLDEGKALDITTIDLAGKTSFADYLVIATGTSTRHVMGLMTNLSADMKKAGYRVQVSGDSGDGNWVVVDLIDIVVHLFTPETRDFYSLEEIWNKKEKE